MDLSDSSGYIQSPLYPLKYMARSRFTWRISVDQGNFIQLRFLSLQAEMVPFETICRSYLKVRLNM